MATDKSQKWFPGLDNSGFYVSDTQRFIEIWGYHAFVIRTKG